jgi:hypothetical protein
MILLRSIVLGSFVSGWECMPTWSEFVQLNLIPSLCRIERGQRANGSRADYDNLLLLRNHLLGGWEAEVMSLRVASNQRWLAMGRAEENLVFTRNKANSVCRRLGCERATWMASGCWRFVSRTADQQNRGGRKSIYQDFHLADGDKIKR